MSQGPDFVPGSFVTLPSVILEIFVQKGMFSLIQHWASYIEHLLRIA